MRNTSYQFHKSQEQRDAEALSKRTRETTAAYHKTMTSGSEREKQAAKERAIASLKASGILTPSGKLSSTYK